MHPPRTVHPLRTGNFEAIVPPSPVYTCTSSSSSSASVYTYIRRTIYLRWDPHSGASVNVRLIRWYNCSSHLCTGPYAESLTKLKGRDVKSSNAEAVEKVVS
ncbi:hypothetical protein OPV22_003892 [Ensete ventricosum]|uniref:Uncharacterized protein n=1 Tax=Ensete ventricosum TaxID=4639 RepID=A0AAV8S257_ENSVE|nr:hypothetical protein OPV22_003892 [Ensete ventricosum]